MTINMSFKLSRAWFLIIIFMLPMSALRAADSSTRPVVIIDGFAPGGGTDVLVRTMAPELSKMFGKQVIVENRTGASGHISAQTVARAAPDGQTLLINTVSMITSRSLYSNLGYDVRSDLVPVTQLTRIANVLVVHPSLPVKNVHDFFSLAKKRPDELIFAVTGLGSISHFVGELVQQRVGIRSTLVPYRGAAPATTALMSGEASYAFIIPIVVSPHISNGRLRALAVSTIRRSPALPHVPTLDESGVKGMDIPQWFGIWAPAKTPAPTVDMINREFVRVVALPKIRERFEREGVEFVGSSPREFGAFVESEVTRWAEVALKAGLKPEF